MRKIALAALALAGLTQATGCIFVSDDTKNNGNGTITGDWSLVSGGAAVSCAQEAVAEVHFSSVGTTSGTTFIDKFTCADMQGTTAPLPIDSYSVKVDAFDAQQHPLSDSPPMSVALHNGGDNAQLGMTIFDFTPPTHSISFSVDYGNAGGSNCSTGGATDSGVGQQTINLIDNANSMCLNVTLLTQGTGTCGAGANGPCNACGSVSVCEETTVVQQIINVPDGSYSLDIAGLKTATNPAVVCFQPINLIGVNVAGADVNLGSIVVPFNPSTADMAACNATKPAGH